MLIFWVTRTSPLTLPLPVSYQRVGCVVYGDLMKIQQSQQLGDICLDNDGRHLIQLQPAGMRSNELIFATLSKNNTPILS